MDVIKLSNPSFEDTPRKGRAVNGIKGWYDCGIINFPKETAPDIHPSNAWGVDDKAYDGNTYLGLVVRDNDTWESVSQKLVDDSGEVEPMRGGHCYRVSMAVMRAKNYRSGSRFQFIKSNDTSQSYYYTTPAVVRLWGGNSYCNQKELLAMSDPIVYSEWKTIELAFIPSENYDFVTIEAFYKLPLVVPYNGHVLIDNLSDIIQVECED